MVVNSANWNEIHRAIALAVKMETSGMQRFISRAPWDDDKIMSKYRSSVNDDLGSPDGALIFE